MAHKVKIDTTKEITVTIDGRVCKSSYGKTILEIARANGIYVPTMCYLTKVKPIASCRMCVVEVEGVNGMVLSCQEKATDGAVVTTQSQELHKQRQSIMKLYNVNHPLECGVCDKSGECDLQNKTLEFGVNQQSFSTKEPHRPVQDWGFVSYDAGLCIMCEKCVRVANEITGNEALQLSVGGYNSTIINVKNDKFDASLGESASVCPVGALVNTHFKYTSNAWELKKIPASCTHCSSGCELTYEVKDDTIYRVSNHAEFTSLCPAGRYGFEFRSSSAKVPLDLARAVEAFSKASTIQFSSIITNEEALILQKLKEKMGYKLVSKEAKAYGDFLTSYSSVSGKSLYNGDLKSIASSDALIVLGSRINTDNPMVKYHMTMASKHNRARVVYMHPLEDDALNNIVTQYIKYEAGSEEGVVALLASAFAQKSLDLPFEIKSILDNLDVGNLSAESNVGEEEIEILVKSFAKKKRFSLIIGADVYAHKRASNIAKIVALFEKYLDFSVILVPPTTNALGVSQICELDDKCDGFTIGYNALGDFTLGSMGEVDLTTPSLSQQEGTITTLNKRVVPTNVALDFEGYTLHDVARALGLGIKIDYTVGYTSKLPTSKGFKSESFDDLPNYFDVQGNEHRGYLLDILEVATDGKVEDVCPIDTFDGAVIYNANPIMQFSPHTALSSKLIESRALIGSSQFALASKLSDGDKISYNIDGIEFSRVFRIDTSIKGTFAFNPLYDMGLSSALLSSYRFSRLEFKKEGRD